MGVRTWGVALALASFAISAAQDAKPVTPARNSYLITGARIVIGPGRELARGVVFIRDGKIANVGETIEVDPAATRIDGTGLTIYAGFIDGFRSGGVKLPPAPSTSARPGTTENAPATMWLGNPIGFAAGWKSSENLEIDRSENDYRSGITTAFVGANRGTIRGTASVVDIAPADVAGRVLAADKAMGMSFRGGTGAGYPSNILGVIAQMRQHLYDAKTLAAGGDLGDEAKPNLPGFNGLAPVVQGRMPVVFDTSLDREMVRAMRLGDEFGFQLMIAGGRDAGLLAPTLAERRIPVLLSAETPTEPANSTSNPVPEPVFAERVARWRQQADAPKTLAAAGVPFAFSSEGDTVSDFLPNVRKAIEQGLAKDVALRALTIGAAEILGLQSQLGTIEVGKRANLVVMTGDFAATTSTVKMTFVDGRLMFEAKEASK